MKLGVAEYPGVKPAQGLFEAYHPSVNRPICVNKPQIFQEINDYFEAYHHPFSDLGWDDIFEA